METYSPIAMGKLSVSWIASVSYTHLDVYKRQALISTPKNRTMEKRTGNRLPITAMCFSFIFSSVLSSQQVYGSSQRSAGSFVPLSALSYALYVYSVGFPL